MQTLKLKTPKSGRIYYDGTYITNGYILYHVERNPNVNLADKGLQALVDQKIPFTRTEQDGLLTGENASPPPCERVLPNLSEYMPAKVTDIGKWDNTKECWYVKIKPEGKDHYQYVDERYIRLFPYKDIMVDKVSTVKAVAVVDGDNVLALIMPVHAE